MKPRLNKLVARLLILTVCLAVANADLYPFLPFGLISCFAVLVAARWLWIGRPQTQAEGPELARNLFIIIIFGFVSSFCQHIALDIDASVKVTVVHRGILNACVVGMFLLLTMFKDPKKIANKSIDGTSQ